MQQPNRGKRFNPIARSGEAAFSFEPPESFGKRADAARLVPQPNEDWFAKGLSLAYRLFSARIDNVYTESLPIVLTYLCVKALNDLLAAVSNVKNGYYFQAWPLLRGALEASELMDYFLRKDNADEIQRWVDKEKRYDSLGWLREALPHTELRKRFFNILNENSHANLTNIDAMSTFKSRTGVKTIAVGPLPFPPTANSSPLTLAASLISYPTRVLWLSQSDVVSTDWVAEFQMFDEATGFMLGDDWTTSNLGEDLLRQPPTS